MDVQPPHDLMCEFMNRRSTNASADCFDNNGSIRARWCIRYRMTGQDSQAHSTLSSKRREHM
jgi:hypothetical protein